MAAISKFPFVLALAVFPCAAADPQDTLVSPPQSITVTADIQSGTIASPDPAQQTFVRSELLDGNPARPGAPVSIPGQPIESASGGIKAPQFFSPGVAGDHGEPIATFWQVGSYLVPNNLSANAHGNGYSDPNIVVPALIESVQTDNGAFNVLEGNHSVNLADTYGLRAEFDPFITVTGDYRDADVTAGWHATAIEAAFGNGLLDRLEHRQQYKFNSYRSFNLGNHQLTALAIGYFGESMIPGLVPVGVPGLHDTIDPRQRDQTHTAEAVLNDVWKLSSASELHLSGFLRTYNLALYSDFGDGLIRQSEFRTVTGGSSNYMRRMGRSLTLMSGLDYLRDAPRRLDLDQYGSINPNIYGPFRQVTGNDVTLNSIAPYVALTGSPARWLRYYIGWRRDEIDITNIDRLTPANSSQVWAGVNSPKATVSLIPPKSTLLPEVAFSFGQAFFTNDPRIGIGSMEGTRVSRARAMQLVVSKTVTGIDLRATFARVTQEQSLAKIDPDTGLQFDEGPSRNRYVTLSAQKRFAVGSIQASFSLADARDLSTGLPVPEAPRAIGDLLGTVYRLPFRLQARGEFEYVGRKPLGDGFTSIPVRELRGSISRAFLEGRLETEANFMIASGYTGQTTEVLALPDEPAPFERVVGVRLPSYVSASFTYHLRRRSENGH
ncbi:MAG TPA: hypothetical protein VK789_03015 [Bryobacteraceae bacterium]|nr:hypothetical protein [Bryobacteraceae bacterium]